MKDRRWIALCAIGLVVLAMMNLPDAASRRVKGAVRDGISPLQAGLRGGVRETRDVVRYVRGLGDLALENRALSEEIVYLRGETRMAQELAREQRLIGEPASRRSASRSASRCWLSQAFMRRLSLVQGAAPSSCPLLPPACRASR